MNREQCRATGCRFYTPPSDINPKDIDPLISDAIIKINSSGWVWTAESCQGHPDADNLTWAGNTRPMLRLVTPKENLGLMLKYWVLAMEIPDEIQGDDPILGGLLSFELYPTHIGDWCEVVVYISARTVFERNLGVKAINQFARLAADGLRVERVNK